MPRFLFPSPTQQPLAPTAAVHVAGVLVEEWRLVERVVLVDKKALLVWSRKYRSSFDCDSRLGPRHQLLQPKKKKKKVLMSLL